MKIKFVEIFYENEMLIKFSVKNKYLLKFSGKLNCDKIFYENKVFLNMKITFSKIFYENKI